MHIEKGTVIEVEEDRVLVESEPTELCASCSLEHSCQLGESGKKRTLWMGNTIGAEEGDIVEFQLRESSVVISSVLIYLLPVFFLVAGGIAGSRIGIPGLDRDLSAAAGAFGLFILSLVIVKGVSSLLVKRDSFMPVLVKILIRRR